jgi:hypothetical protein
MELSTAVDQTIVATIEGKISEKFSTIFRPLSGINIFATHVCISDVFLKYFCEDGEGKLYHSGEKFYFKPCLFSSNRSLSKIRKDILYTFKEELVDIVYIQSPHNRNRTMYEINKVVWFINFGEPDNRANAILLFDYQSNVMIARLESLDTSNSTNNNSTNNSNNSDIHHAPTKPSYPKIVLSYPRESSRNIYRKDIPSKFMCSICTDVLLNPVMSSVGNVYCEECIGEWIYLKSKATDPLTRMHITTNLIPALVIWTEMNEWKQNENKGEFSDDKNVFVEPLQKS